MHIHKKKRGKHIYYYLREIKRVNGKPTVTAQIYLGTADKIAKLCKSENNSIVKVKSFDYGSLWLCNAVLQELEIAKTIDSIVANSGLLTVGDFFYLAVMSRMIRPSSKNSLGHWLKDTAISKIYGKRITGVSSAQFWKKWGRVGESEYKDICSKFFQIIANLKFNYDDVYLYDTSNYFTFFDQETKSELAKCCKSKAGRNNLRHIGLGILVSRQTKLPLLFHVFSANLNDYNVFKSELTNILSVIRQYKAVKKYILVFDAGMNTKINFKLLGKCKDIDFITNFSPHSKKHASLFLTPLKTFTALNINPHRRNDKSVKAYRTTIELYSKKITCIIYYNPATAFKQKGIFKEKIHEINSFIKQAKINCKELKQQWTDPTIIEKRYKSLCLKLYISPKLFNFQIEKYCDKVRISAPINKQLYKSKLAKFGKELLLCSDSTCSTSEIVQIYFDRYKVESTFRASKNPFHSPVQPIFHWTDQKIKCHFLVCFLALVASRLIELKLAKLNLSANSAIDTMQSWRYCLLWPLNNNKPYGIIEETNELQKQIISLLPCN